MGLLLPLLIMMVVPPVLARKQPQALVYGKYYSLNASSGAKSTAPNTAYLFTPQGNAGAKVPMVIQIHGGGFTGGTAYSEANSETEAITSQGMAYVSVNYRLVATRYYYGEAPQLEELVTVDSDGRLTLSQKTADEYKVRRGRTEFNTKCSYDAVQMLEYLIVHADELGVDPHRISFTGGSAGGGEIHYLTWVYHQWNMQRYTPRGEAELVAEV